MWKATKNKLKKLSPSSSQVRIRVLTSVEQLMPRNDYEREALDLLKNQTYYHVRILEPLFFIKKGLKVDMTRAFSRVGWYNFADMMEPGSKFLTMEFLMTLSFEEEVMSMLAHWQKMIAGRSPIDITTLVTRIATHVKALDNAQVTYLPWGEDYQLRVGVEHFMQGHMMRKGPGNSLFMTYPGYDREDELPCPRLSLYSVKSYLLQMQKRSQLITASPVQQLGGKRDRALNSKTK
ncbi:hypothetical protein C2845_PM13G11230 [Panicum miliaceum]|uniref:Uncharacterized protein n=1 Tax=Panicum miliaceum TaxID=4540 RepID=A0A3L6RMT9_PANMI|nr:hypothetical protein C2845_PM13G11230 [Panicum miliaceum]